MHLQTMPPVPFSAVHSHQYLSLLSFWLEKYWSLTQGMHNDLGAQQMSAIPDLPLTSWKPGSFPGVLSTQCGIYLKHVLKFSKRGHWSLLGS